MDKELLGRFIKDLISKIGKEKVVLEKEQLAKYHFSTIPVHRYIPAVIKPNNVEEVQEIIRTANVYGIPLYTISTGKNWGYGTSNPVQNDNIILDLRDMNSIKVVKDLAYAVIEPGVTQQMLYEYLDRYSPDLMMDPTGSGPSCSVLGNTLERGYGITPYGDHFEALCGMEVVLADGSLLRTGFGHYEKSTATHLFKYGVGPYLDGMFTQSNFGVVTKIGVWLMPRPETFEAGYFFCRREEDLEFVIDATRKLLLNRVVKGSINLLHRNRGLTVLMQYPWERMEGKTPLDAKIWEELAKEKGVGIWNGVVALYGTKGEIRTAKRIIKKELRGCTEKLQFLSRPLLQLLERFQKPLSLILRMNISELLKALKPSFELMNGKPGEVSLPTPYWRMRKTPPEKDIDPAKDNCGLFWFAPVIPMTYEHVRNFMEIIEPIFEQHKFEPCITFTTVTHRAFDCTLPILYNKEDSEETERASQCYNAVLRACMKEGYIPYRFGIQSMKDITEQEDNYWSVVQRIKKALDPKGILSPGRYCG